MTPLAISIVTPCLNSSRYLQATIDSVVSQTGGFELEYFLVDGGSTDGTIDILRANQSRTTGWVCEPDRGMYDAIARGLDRSSGEVVAWLNSDDTYFPWTLATVAEVFRELPEVQWLTTLTPAAIDQTGTLVGFPKHPGFSRAAFLDGVYVGFAGVGDALATEFVQQESTFWRRSLWNAVGSQAFGGYRLAGDFALWCAFMRHAPLHGIEASLGAFRFRSGQLSERRVAYLHEARRALDALRADCAWTPAAVDPGGREYVGEYVVRTIEPNSSRWATTRERFVVLPRSNPLKDLVMHRRVG